MFSSALTKAKKYKTQQYLDLISQCQITTYIPGPTGPPGPNNGYTGFT